MWDFRAVGEFEKQESVLLIWSVEPYATQKLDVDIVSIQIVYHLMDSVNVIICCYDHEIQERAKSGLSSYGVDINKIQFVIYPSKVPYPRDFGAEILINSLGDRARADFRFDMYGYSFEEDEASKRLRNFSSFHAKEVGINRTIRSTLIGEGGDREFNGNGVMMSIYDTEINKRNPDKEFEEVESELKRVFGLDQIIWLPQSSYDDEDYYSGPIPSKDGSFTSYRSSSANGHIDEICRFADEKTIIIASIEEKEARTNKLHALNKERLDKAYEVIKNSRDNEEKPFRILKMPAPEPIYIDIFPGDGAFVDWNDETFTALNGTMRDGTPFPKPPVNVLPALSYCNFLIANDVVIAQKYYEEGMSQKIKEKDEESLKILQEAFPGKHIIQINTLALNIYGGGIHCHTRNIPFV